MGDEKRLLKEQEKKLRKEQEQLLQMQNDLKVEFEEQKKQFLIDLENQKSLYKKATPVIEEEPVIIEAEEEVIEEKVEEEIKNSFLSFINVATVKGDLFKSFL